VRIDYGTADPHTTAELLQAVETAVRPGVLVAIQRYGESNRELDDGLKQRGAQTVELPAYRWSMPADTGPLAALIDALERAEVDAVVFTSASQARNLFDFARASAREPAMRAGLARSTIFSIGPVCSRSLQALGVRVDAEASPPKLGPLIALLRERV
jgi:uroporphyrinogen-III synthase